MTSPLGPVTSTLVDAERRRVAAQNAAAARWSDAAYRQVDGRVLRPLADETRAFHVALQLLDSALGRCLTRIKE